MNAWKPVLACVLACSLLAVYVVDRQTIQTRRMEAARSSRLIPFDVVDTREVELTNPSGAFLLKRGGSGAFELLKPIEAKADEGQVKALVDNFHGARIGERFPVTNLKEYGLDDPISTIRIQGTLDDELVEKQYAIGSITGTLGRIYFQDLDNPNEVLTTADWVMNQTLKSLNTLRDKTVFQLDAGVIQSFVVEKDGDSLLVARNPDYHSGWDINSKKAANSDWVERLLRSMENLQAVEILDSPTSSSAQLGLEPPMISISFEDANKEVALLHLGKGTSSGDSFFVSMGTDEPVYVVQSRYLREVVTPPNRWQTPRLIWSNRDHISGLKTYSGDLMMEIEREENRWIFPEFPDLPVREEFVTQYLQLIELIEGRDYVGEGFTEEVENQEYGIRLESYAVKLMTSKGTEEGFILGSLSSDAEFSFVKRIQDGSIWRIDPEKLKGVRVSRKELQDKRIASGFAEETALCVITLSTGTRFRLYYEDGAWKFKDPSKPVFIVPNSDAIAFLNSVEEVQWSSELATRITAPSDIEFLFLNKRGEEVYSFKVLQSEFSQKLVETSKGLFFVEETEFTRMLERFGGLLQPIQAQ
jgi:hypothetical protein